MLEFSPDWDARLCYLLVLLCAVISARVQVLGRLEILKQKIVYAWSQPSTWLVFTIYLFLPLALFWLLDRTGAIKDTSAFAALLVGLAYPAILSGGTSLKPTEGLAGVFDWLNKALDSVTARTTSMVALEAQIFERELVDHLEKDAQARKLVEELALRYAPSRAAAQTELASKKGDPRAQAEALYDFATGSALGLKPITELLPHLGAQARSPYTKAVRSIWLYGLLSAVLAVAALLFAFSPTGELNFLIWRITKVGIAESDLHRTSLALAKRLANDEMPGAPVRARLVEAVQLPGMESKRADQILQLIVAARGDTQQSRFFAIANEFADALRVNSVDVRARINHTLLLLADEILAVRKDELAKSKADREMLETLRVRTEELAKALDSLRAWKPLGTESLIDLERKVKEWHQWWQLTFPTARS